MTDSFLRTKALFHRGKKVASPLNHLSVLRGKYKCKYTSEFPSTDFSILKEERQWKLSGILPHRLSKWCKQTYFYETTLLLYRILRRMSYCPREMMSFWAAAQEWDPSILPSSSFYCNWKIWWTRSTASMMSYCPVHPGLAAAVHEAADRRYVTLAQGTATLEPIQSSLLFHGGHLRRWLQVGSPAHLNRWCRFI